jgi:hypothetical protein
MVALVYYVKRTTADVVPFPADLDVIAGNAAAQKAQPKSIVSWGCDGFASSKRYVRVPACTVGQALDLRIQFPNCWNGRTSDSADHKSHMAYSAGGRCPASHPVAVPAIVLILLYLPVPERAQVASGRFGVHADFMNGWEQHAFAKLVASLNS